MDKHIEIQKRLDALHDLVISHELRLKELREEILPNLKPIINLNIDTLCECELLTEESGGDMPQPDWRAFLKDNKLT